MANRPREGSAPPYQACWSERDWRVKEPSDAPALEGIEAPTAQKKRGIVRRLYDWTIHWAETPYALWAVLFVACAALCHHAAAGDQGAHEISLPSTPENAGQLLVPVEPRRWIPEAALGVGGGDSANATGSAPIETNDETRRAAMPEKQRKRGLIRRLYDWTIAWAQAPYALWALFLLAFAEASFFPIPPDALLIAMALGTPSRSLLYAAVSTCGSVVGGVLGYAIGAFFFQAVGRRIISFFRAWNTYHAVSKRFSDHGFLYIFTAALTPIPYKVFTIAAGACRVNVGALVAASVIGRGLRFFAVGMLFMLFGSPIKTFIDRYFNLLTIAFLALGVAGFVCVKLLWRGATAEPEAPGSAPTRQEKAIEEDAAASP